jgi:hypothetical protein
MWQAQEASKMRFFLPNAQNVFQRLVGLKLEQGTALVEILDDESGNLEKVRKVASTLLLPEDTAEELLQYAKFLRRYHEDDPCDVSNVQKELELISIEYDLKLPNSKDAATFLCKILEGKSPAAQLRSKKKKIQRGIGCSLDEASSLVSVRPVFDKGRKKIETWVIASTIKLEFTTEDDGNDAVVLDLDEEGVKKLKEMIDQLLQKKIALESSLASERISI